MMMSGSWRRIVRSAEANVMPILFCTDASLAGWRESQPPTGSEPHAERVLPHATMLPCDAYRHAPRVKTFFVMPQPCSAR
jgi:hypothetical protein